MKWEVEYTNEFEEWWVTRPLAKVPIAALVGERLKVKGERKINCFTPCPLPLTLTSAAKSTLEADTQDAIDVVVGILQEQGPNLPFPYSSKINGSRHSHMRELRSQHGGEPYRILYAIDPRRVRNS